MAEKLDRQNLRAVKCDNGTHGALIPRLLDELDAQDTRIAELEGERNILRELVATNFSEEDVHDANTACDAVLTDLRAAMAALESAIWMLAHRGAINEKHEILLARLKAAYPEVKNAK